ncbi:MAG: SDR family oxidoreductase [Bacteroidetes bacterium]|nr:SDR family oxidoreductase [Bacteroidota bacterium]
MIKVGITGQTGFIGTHLYNTLNLDKENFETILFDDRFFSETILLEEWVSKCDVIIHLAALNRHNDPDVIYNTNISLVKQLIAALENTNTTPHVLFSSSTQEANDNLYGKSKKEGRRLLTEWATKNNTQFTGLIIPNVFGPFGNPYYNSVVATFCHQLTHNQIPKIEVDGDLKLIYIGELVHQIIDHILLIQKNYCNEVLIEQVPLQPTAELKVSNLLRILQEYKNLYFENGVMPAINTSFERNLFNTFLCYINHATFFPFKLKMNTDQRGSFVETIKLNSGGQVSFSTTVAGITRGNHFHTRKAERFAVIKGKALIELRKVGTDEILSFELTGEHPSFVDMPIWFTHNIKNIGSDELYTIFWINEFFDQNDPDTFFEKV